MTVKEKKAVKRMTAKQQKALELIKAIRAKITGLKHGYIADDEFDELENLVKKVK